MRYLIVLVVGVVLALGAVTLDVSPTMAGPFERPPPADGGVPVTLPDAVAVAGDTIEAGPPPGNAALDNVVAGQCVTARAGVNPSLLEYLLARGVQFNC